LNNRILNIGVKHFFYIRKAANIISIHNKKIKPAVEGTGNCIQVNLEVYVSICFDTIFMKNENLFSNSYC